MLEVNLLLLLLELTQADEGLLVLGGLLGVGLELLPVLGLLGDVGKLGLNLLDLGGWISVVWPFWHLEVGIVLSNLVLSGDLLLLNWSCFLLTGIHDIDALINLEGLLLWHTLLLGISLVG